MNSKFVKRGIFKLIAIYFMSSFWLLFVSGQWWDDWGIWTNTLDGLRSMYLEAGSPWSIINTTSVMWLPNWGYRVVVFLLYLITSLLFYEILCQIDFINEEDAFWIAAIAMTVPVNDARVTLICYGYSLSLPLFMLCFYIITRLKDVSGGKRMALRIISLLCLLYSYTTESLLVFTGLIWLYLFYLVWKENVNAYLAKKLITFIRLYWDYFFLPFVFFIVKGIFFKPYGNYEGYNSVTLKSLLISILFSPLSCLKTGLYMLRSYFWQIGLASILVIIAVIVIYLFVRSSQMKNESVANNFRQNIIMLLLGCVVFYAGIFAYIVVRGGGALRTTGVGSRDMLLAGFGIGMMVIYFMRIIPVRKTFQNLIPILMIVLGIFHFNEWYLNYQEDWYYQQELKNAIEENNGFGNDHTILCDFLTGSPIEGTRFYTVNGMSYTVTGKTDKFYFSGIGDLSYGVEFNKDFLDEYSCHNYDSSDMTIDGVLLINNNPISNIDLVRIRFQELFYPEKYEKEIAAHTDATYIKINRETSDKIYAEYQDESLTSEMLRQMVGVQ